MAYNTNYRGIKTKSGEVLYVSTSTACFANFTHQGYPKDHIESQFTDDRTMEVFHVISKIQLKPELVKRWIDDLNTMGFPIDLKETELKHSDDYPKTLNPGLNYVFSLDFSKFNSKAHVKVALYLLRYTYEERLYQVIDKLYKMKDENPDDCTWELFQFACMTCNGSTSGHYIYSNYIMVEIMSLETLKDRHMLSWANNKYRNNEIQALSINLKAPGQYGAHIGPTKYPEIYTMNLNEYKELSNQIKNGKRG